MADRSLPSILRAALPALVISAGATSWCWWAVGQTLVCFLVSIFLLTLYAPPLVLAEKYHGRWIVMACVVLGPAIVLAFAIASIDVTASEWLLSPSFSVLMHLH